MLHMKVPPTFQPANVMAHTLPDRSLRVHVRGELDAACVDLLRYPLEHLMIANSRVEIDMKDVSFLDSSGIRVLIVAQKNGAAVGTSVRVVNPSPIVTRVLSVTGLLERFVETG
jgi:anti-anti-sigma factor